MSLDLVTPTAVLLADCPAGTDFRVVAIAEADTDACRLRDMGLYEGAVASVVTAGDPVVLAFCGTRFAVCLRCAERLTVEVIASRP